MPGYEAMLINELTQFRVLEIFHRVKFFSAIITPGGDALG